MKQPPTNVFKGIYTIASFISILLFAYILNFLWKLEAAGCACAMDWRRDYIMSYMAFMIFFNFFSLILMYTNPSPILRRMHALMSPVSLVLAILFIVFTFQYVHRLYKEKCQCSEDLGRSILMLVATIDAAVFSVMGLIIVASIIAMMLGFKK